MPNILAYLVLFSWPLIGIYIAKKKPREDAAILLLLIPFLFLPERVGINLPGLPPLDKVSIPVLTIFLVWGFGKNKLKLLALPKDKIAKVLVLMLFIMPFGVVLTNRDSYFIGPAYFPALTISDFISTQFITFCKMYIPFVVGWKILNSQDAHAKVLRLFLVFGLFYSVLMLYEIRMSPQLHAKVYGFFPHDFAQQVRQGGFRPVVFTSHGIVLAIQCAFWVLIAAALYKLKDPSLKGRGKWILLYLLTLLILCKTLGALAIALLMLPVVLFMSTSRQVKIAGIVAWIVLLYPMLRAEGWVPIQQLSDKVAEYSEDRAQSLQFRIDNEEALLERASMRSLFGWGGWGRNRVFDEKTGEDLSVTDGYWIIIMGVFGWVGYIAIFGLLTYPVISLARYTKKSSIRLTSYTSAIAIILAVNLLDMLPNASFSSLSMLFAGALYGFREKLQYPDNSRRSFKAR